MRLMKSVCTTVFFPATRKSVEEFARMAEFVAGLGAQGIEFYYDGPATREIGKILERNRLDGIFIAVLPSKEQKLWLCHEDPAAREAAVKMVCGCMDWAQDNGIQALMLNSGRNGKDENKNLDALADSVERLHAHAERSGYKQQRFCLEPSDATCEAMHLIGPYAKAAAFAERMRKARIPFELTMDTAHSSEDGEDFVEALRGVKPYCRHVHFANCFLADKSNQFYGDKHLGFEYPETVWGPEALAKLFAEIEKIYPEGEELRLALEVLCRDEDPYAYFKKTWESLPFLH